MRKFIRKQQSRSNHVTNRELYSSYNKTEIEWREKENITEIIHGNCYKTVHDFYLECDTDNEIMSVQEAEENNLKFSRKDNILYECIDYEAPFCKECDTQAMYNEKAKDYYCPVCIDKS